MNDVKTQPTGWADLNKPDLIAAAEFFGSDAEGTKEKILANLAEDGVTWELYAKNFLAPTKEEEVKETVALLPEDDFIETEEGNDMSETDELVTRPKFEEVVSPQAKYLIKMERENPYFEWRRYKFTQERPFAVMPASDAETILTAEEGFRQAFPSEVEDFYG